MNRPLALVVEDDPILNQVFALSLQDEFETETFKNGKSAFQRLSVVTPRLVLLDLNLPDISGADILDYIRSDERLRDTAVIVCTAYDRQLDIVRRQANFVLLKPVSPFQLRQIASRLK